MLPDPHLRLPFFCCFSLFQNCKLQLKQGTYQPQISPTMLWETLVDTPIRAVLVVYEVELA